MTSIGGFATTLCERREELANRPIEFRITEFRMIEFRMIGSG